MCNLPGVGQLVNQHLARKRVCLVIAPKWADEGFLFILAANSACFPLVYFSIPDSRRIVEVTPVLISRFSGGHIVPKKGDSSQDTTPLTSGFAAGILETGSSPDGLAFRQNKPQEKGVQV